MLSSRSIISSRSINGLEHPSARFGLNRESGVLTDAQERQLGLSVVQQAQQQSNQNPEMDPRMRAALASFASRLGAEISSKGLTGALQANYTQEWEQLKTVSQQIDLSRRELTEGHIARTALIVNNPNLDDTERQRRLQMEAQLRLMEEARIAELERRRREAEENLRLLNQVTSAQRTMCQAAQAVNESERRLRNANGRQSGSSDGLYAGLDDDLTKWLDQKMQQDHWGLVSGAQQVVSTQLQTTEQPESTDTERQPASQESQATADSRATAGGIPARRQVMEILLKDRATQLTSTRRVEVDGAQPATLLNEGRTGARSTAFSPIQFVAMMEPDAISGLRFGAPLVGTPDLLGQDSRNAYRPSLFPGERVGLTQA